VYQLFSGCATELTHHMLKEESMLFPAIKKMVMRLEQGLPIERFFFGSIGNPIAMMQFEHEGEGERFARINELTGGFTPPDDACTTYRVAYYKLQEFQNDLFTHIHLENNILFPKALALEQQYGS
jgi:regulator of cell morphogenesis and NO signaling